MIKEQRKDVTVMKRSVKAAAAMLCGILAVSAASCASQQTYPLTIDGEQIRAGIYLYQQFSSVNSAESKLGEEQPDLDTTADGFDFTKQTVEGKSFGDWVKDNAIEECREFIAVKRLFASNGLTLTAEQNASVKSNVNSIWDETNTYAQYLYGTDTVGAFFEKMGIGKQSFKELQEVSEMRTALFDHLYGEGGELAATQDEINAALKSDYSAIEYITYQLDNGDGAQAYVDRINNGESFEEIFRSYTDAYNTQEYEKELAEYEASKNEAAQSEDGVTEVAEDADTADTAEAEPPVKPDPISVPETDSLIVVINKDSTTPSEDFVKQVTELAENTVSVVSVTSGETTTEYIVKKFDILSVPSDKTESAVTSLRTSLKEDEFNEMLHSAGDAYTVSEDSSINLYKVNKIIDVMNKK